MQRRQTCHETLQHPGGGERRCCGVGAPSSQRKGVFLAAPSGRSAARGLVLCIAVNVPTTNDFVPRLCSLSGRSPARRQPGKPNTCSFVKLITHLSPNELFPGLFAQNGSVELESCWGKYEEEEHPQHVVSISPSLWEEKSLKACEPVY